MTAPDDTFREKIQKDNSLITQISNVFGNDIEFRKKALESALRTDKLRILDESEKNKLKVFLENLKILNEKNVDNIKKAKACSVKIQANIDALSESIYNFADSLSELVSTQQKIEQLCSTNIDETKTQMMSSLLNELKLSMYKWSDDYSTISTTIEKYIDPTLTKLEIDNMNFAEVQLLSVTLDICSKE